MAKYIYLKLCMHPWYDKKICQTATFVRLKVFEYIGVLVIFEKIKDILSKMILWDVRLKT